MRRLYNNNVWKRRLWGLLFAGLMLTGQAAQACDGPGGQPLTQDPKSACKLDPQQRFRLIKQAIILVETNGRNCATNGGCPSQTVNPWRQPASYGPAQTTVSTTVELLIQDAALRNRLGISLQELRAARARAQAASQWYRKIYLGNGRINPVDTVGTDPTAFERTTGLSAQDFALLDPWRRVMLIAEPIRRQGGPQTATAQQRRQLIHALKAVHMSWTDLRPYLTHNPPIWLEAEQGLEAKAIFTDPVLKQKLLDYFKSPVAGNVNDQRLRDEIQYYTTDPRFSNESEQDWAVRVGYAHNSGFYSAVGSLQSIYRASYIKGSPSHPGFLYWWDQLAPANCRFSSLPGLG